MRPDSDGRPAGMVRTLACHHDGSGAGGWDPASLRPVSLDGSTFLRAPWFSVWSLGVDSGGKDRYA